VAAVGRAVGALLTLAGWLLGIPAALVIFAGWPVPHRVPSGAEILDTLAKPDLLTQDTVVPLAVGLMWLIWAVAVVYTTYILTTVARLRVPRIPAPLVFQRVITGLVGSITVTATAHPALAAVSAVTAPAPDIPNQTATDPGEAPASRGAASRDERTADAPRPTRHRVIRGDTLWDIAEDSLGDPYRWDDIYDANRGRRQPDGRALRDPDLIQPGWTLTIPSSTTAKPSTEPPPRPAEATSHPAPAHPPTTAAPSTSPTLTPPAEPQHSGTSAPSGDHRSAANAPHSNENGVELTDGSWLPWALAGTLAAVTTTVWLQRRRRYTGTDEDDPPVMPAPALAAIRRAAISAPHRPATAPADENNGEPPAPFTTLPSRVTALIGDGAVGAARAAMVAALASGEPKHPESCVEVITDRSTLATILGGRTDLPAGWARLHVADDVYEALADLEA
jgi:LysM repeat protein